MKFSINKSPKEIAGYTNWQKKLILMILGGSLGILGVSLICLNFGVVSIHPKEIFSLIWNSSLDKTNSLIVWQLRAPRIIMATLTGIALATVGGAFQGILRNPLADPYILGVSAGAALGACIGIALQYATGYYLASYLPLFAFLGAMLSLYLVYLSSKISYSVNSTGLLLAGVAINFLFSALITVLLALSKRELHSMIFWLMGDLSTADWKKISLITLPVIIGCLLLFFSSLDLNALSLGEEEALHLGVNTGKLRMRIFFIGSIIIATVVSFTGLIGFVGLIIPHIARLLIGPDHRVMLPASALLGAIFLILCDTLARMVISPSEIPIGAITALVGAPMFIYLLRRK
ncbi:MAG: iron ABC transporter [Candidatus Infernicultor aquiphilus]|uniref:Iron ABC transporter n=1 Tax=Candidatus Infernicultor aquiphilus TaxID=1805029 RepID=A0A1J5H053_9BACT|nr:iron ABC transporter permease [bacterium]OIP72528.1 MAG: iron ABC transporter [Candidatus Atribacteria bacterium CG2_30_33_13]PIU24827.1 MAG: iron ABC transporter [Candidatus Atribacteria bacterium CG08_land_8_20_14_0_20_33_29]PIW11184.1 MAG: iron ABC transporter [Candidatus Atribacteria bacterium CG17_big_fil_post_rev_8_21_14_2_50_34_11]PIX33643.1 MAG: iron ABC transporter [Candidatus Atribacteria bacterium CG_4_8_14_3_um_filter_34_18]PIY33965.1 MAG: iron ABC transporter [Candidatus Atriba